jgi:hypothetical protein
VRLGSTVPGVQHQPQNKAINVRPGQQNCLVPRTHNLLVSLATAHSVLQAAAMPKG